MTRAHGLTTHGSVAMTNEDEILVVSSWQRRTILTISRRMASLQLGEAFQGIEEIHISAAHCDPMPLRSNFDIGGDMHLQVRGV